MTENKKEDKKEIKTEELTTEELQLISRVLYNSRWNGDEWQKTIMPLLVKVQRMIDAPTN